MMNDPVQNDPLLAQVERLADSETELHTRLVQASAHLEARESEIRTAINDLQTQIRALPLNPVATGTNGGRSGSDYLAYQQLIGRIREIVRNTVQPNAKVIVVSRGDDELLRLDGCTGWHFPQTETGVYAGHYPSDSAAAIAELETLRARGGEYLLFPSTAFWWLDYYVEFKAYLEREHHAVVRRQDACIIYALQQANAPSHKAKRKQLPSSRRLKHPSFGTRRKV